METGTVRVARIMTVPTVDVPLAGALRIETPYPGASRSSARRTSASGWPLNSVRYTGLPASLSAFTIRLPPLRAHSARISRRVTFSATSVTIPPSNEMSSLRAP